jgi:hypothetical protein
MPDRSRVIAALSDFRRVSSFVEDANAGQSG